MKEGEEGRHWKEAGQRSVTGHRGARARDCNCSFKDHTLVFVRVLFEIRSLCLCVFFFKSPT